ncbi:hypothetical protein Q1695_003082 [Nippostrongylus brasiliensis]|nr:hypothetical protein Q1695_003082 [Nippostrongylus brasiliensis]
MRILDNMRLTTLYQGKTHPREDANIRAIAYRTIEEVRLRKVAYGGKCIRGRSNSLPNHPNCTAPDVTFNKVRSVLIDQDFVSRRCKDGHDWAIIELEEPIEFTDSTHPICLPSRKPIIGNVLTVAGWGRSYGVECFVLKLPSDADDFLCATSLNKNDYFAPRTCHGDSGSGMEQIDERGRSVLIALTSFGTLGCPANELARFTRVDPYLKPICTYTGICYST